ncbi:hypothetical protein JB92DRAFT_2972849, partial [Gautieria morchelliformis]
MVTSGEDGRRRVWGAGSKHALEDGKADWGKAPDGGSPTMAGGDSISIWIIPGDTIAVAVGGSAGVFRAHPSL